jgi:hypothetical protein
LPPPKPTVHTHDGFLARAQLGVATTTLRIDSVPGSFSSAGAAINVDLGGAITPNVLLYAELLLIGVNRFDAPGAPAATAGMSTASGAGLSSLGVGAAYCFMPVNVCLGGAVSGASLTFSGVLAQQRIDQMGQAQKSTTAGGAFKLAVSKEWWLGNDIGLGVALQYLVTGGMRDTIAYGNVDNAVWHAQGFALVGSFTYN